MLKPQDLVVLSKLVSSPDDGRSFPRLASALGLSVSETHAAVKRAATSGLLDPTTRTVRKAAMLEFTVHGLKYVFPPVWKGVTRGVPTSYAASPLNATFSPGELPPVWPHARGSVRGEGLVPLYKTAPDAALRDPELYAWLALIDAIRSGRARERRLAIEEVQRRLSG